MRRAAYARLAGATFLLYIAVSLPAMVLLDRATRGEDMVRTLASIAGHAADLRLAIILSVITCLAAVVLGVALFAVTRTEEEHLALLAMACRLGEGVLNGVWVVLIAGLLWLGEAGSGTGDAAAFTGLGAFAVELRGSAETVSAIFFAVGSMLFAWLFVRGELVPAPSAWWGLAASTLLVAGLTRHLAGFLTTATTLALWTPMGLFELVLGPWLLIKGVPTGSGNAG